jgi:hypothetical protein
MGSLLVKEKDNKPSTSRGIRAKKTVFIPKHKSRIRWVILSKEDVEAERPKDACEYVI